MKNLLVLPFLLLFSSLFAQDPCDDVDITSVQYSPFTDTVIIVELINNSVAGFPYPGFVLINANGDTVAKEDVDLFGIGQESLHRLNVIPGVQDPLSNFVGDLELYTGFYDVFACSWDLNQSLCAAEPCDSLIIGLDNWGGALVVGDFEWTVRDESNSIVETGQFTMNVNPQYWRHGLCLEPGEYSYTLEALTQPSGGGPVISVSSTSSFASPTITEPLDWFNDPITAIQFPFYSFCAESPNGIGDLSQDSGIDLRYEMESNQLICSQQMTDLKLFSSDGRLAHSTSPQVKQVGLPELAFGTYIAVVSTSKGEARLKVVLK